MIAEVDTEICNYRYKLIHNPKRFKRQVAIVLWINEKLWNLQNVLNDFLRVDEE